MLRCPLHMVMITHFNRYINPKTGKTHILSTEYPACPECGKIMTFHDTCNRHGLNEKAECTWYVLRRFQCCGSTHREIPDFLFPFKHYEADVVQSAIDENTDKIAADESTIRCWRRQWRTQEMRVRLTLMALLAQVRNEFPKLTGTCPDIIILIKKEYSRWLAFVLRMLTHGDIPLYTQFAFCHSP